MQSLWLFFGRTPVKSHGTGVLWECVHYRSLLQIAPEIFTVRHLTIRIMVFQAKLIFYFSLNWIYLISVLVSTVVHCAIFLSIFSEEEKIFITLDSSFLHLLLRLLNQQVLPTHTFEKQWITKMISQVRWYSRWSQWYSDVSQGMVMSKNSRTLHIRR